MPDNKIKADHVLADHAGLFHMIRHFEKPAPGDISKLLLSGFTQDQIQIELNQPGSKFFSHFACDLSELIDKCLFFHQNTMVNPNGNLILTGNVPEHLYPGKIGSLSVVPVASLTDFERSLMFIRKNRGVDLNHFITSDFPSTNEFTFIVRPEAERYRFVTAFPGNPGLPVPDPKQSPDFRMQCEAFWKEQVFLVTK
jgi:hypothetical protein